MEKLLTYRVSKLGNPKIY